MISEIARNHDFSKKISVKWEYTPHNVINSITVKANAVRFSALVFSDGGAVVKLLLLAKKKEAKK